MDRKLLEILCCPITKQPVRALSQRELEMLNGLVQDGQLRYLDDTPVEAPFEEALVTDNGTRVYRVDDGIPIMLEERSVSGSAIERSGQP